MTERSPQITYGKGRPFAAYLYLARRLGEKAARTVPSAGGLLVVDYGRASRAVGIEITAPEGALGATIRFGRWPVSSCPTA